MYCQKLIHLFSRCICYLIVCSFFLVSEICCLMSFAAQEISKVEPVSEILVQGKSNKKAVSRIVENLLDKQGRILSNIETEQKIYKESLKQEIYNLTTVKQNIYQDFGDLYVIYTSNKNEPIELTLLDEQLHRFIFQLDKHYTPLKNIHKQVGFRLQQLNTLINSLEVIDDDSIQLMLKRAHSLLDEYAIFKKSLEKVLKPTEELLTKLAKTSTELEERMPKLWLHHYIHKSVNFFDENQWLNYARVVQEIPQTAKLILLNELPSTRSAWVAVCFNIVFMGIILGLVLFTAHRMITLFPLFYCSLCKKLLSNSLPWLALGIALEYASWYGGNRYQIISALGMLCLCYGHVRFSWEMFCFEREDLPDSSPFLPMVFLLAGSFLLISFVDFSLLLTALWIIFLASFLWYLCKTPQYSVSALKYLRVSFHGILLAGIFIALEGNVYFSFLIVLVATCLILGIHQAQACLRVITRVDSSLPKNGIYALISGLVLAVSIPLVLVISLLSPFVWILTFPGGEYLLKVFSNFDINIGKASFNAVQVLSIIVIFYLVKSTIRVSCNYIDTTWAINGVTSKSSVATLTTPIKTTIFFGCWGLFALYVLKVIGFSLTSLTVIAGGLSVGVGLGMQGIVQNTFSGFLLIYGRNIREGDVVVVGGTRGIVQKISLRATKVRTFDNAVVFVPNSEFLANAFVNWTHNGRIMRNIISVGVDYKSDLPLVRKTILAVLEENTRVLKKPVPHVCFMDFGASTLNFEIRFWISSYIQRVEICSDIRFALIEAFREHDIEMAFPQQDVHIKWDTTDQGAVAHKQELESQFFHQNTKHGEHEESLRDIAQETTQKARKE